MDGFLIKADAFLRTKIGLRKFLAALVVFNLALYALSSFVRIPDLQARRDASGFSIDKGKEFLYFYYYTGAFPLGTLAEEVDYSEEGARKEIIENGTDLIMEYKHWSRLGENARMFAFLPDAYLRGSPGNPSIRLFNCLVFILSLSVLFIGFWRVEKAVLGAGLVILINLTPFFLFEVYTRENIFGLLGSAFFFILGLTLPTFLGKESSKIRMILLGIIASCSLGFFSEIRNEVSVVLASLLLIYFLAERRPIFQKTGMILLCLGTFWGTKKVIKSHFDQKFIASAKLVAENGGHVYTGDRIAGHKIWHPIFCGLGDFDTKYGYEWNDKVAYQYAYPILNEKYGMDIAYSGEYHTDNYYDEAKLYYKKFDEIEAYEWVVRDKVLADIQADPFWYIGILARRIVKVFTTTLPLPFLGWLLFPLLFYSIKNKRWVDLKFIIISLPLSLTPILIYAQNGSTYNSVFVYSILVILLAFLLERRLGFHTLQPHE